VIPARRMCTLEPSLKRGITTEIKGDLTGSISINLQACPPQGRWQEIAKLFRRCCKAKFIHQIELSREGLEALEVPPSPTKILRPAAVCLLSLLTKWINCCRYRVSRFEAAMLRLAHPQGEPLHGQNDDIEFRRTTCVRADQFSLCAGNSR